MPTPAVPSPPAVAADGLLAPLLAGPPRRGEVVVATPLAGYAMFEDGSAVGVLDPRAVRVPGSVVVAGAELVPVLGDRIVLGGGAVVVGGVRLVPRRWWDSRVPPVEPPVPPPAAAPLPDAVPAVASWLEPALIAGGELLARVVDALVGLGPGLTPAGDDVLAGALVALAAARDSERRPALTAAVRLRRHRTTAVSGAFLDHAAAGHAVPELGRYVDALAEGRSDGRVVQDLERVGASSGAALAAGARIGLRVAAMVRQQRRAAEVA